MKRISEEWHDPYGHLDDDSRELVARVIRLAMSKVPHRLLCRFDLVDGLLGISVSVERKHNRHWVPVRPETWIPMTAQSNAVFALLLYVGEHGRLPAFTTSAEKSP